MFNHSKMFSLLAVLALAAMMVLAACGGGNETATVAEPTAAVEEPAATEVVAAPTELPAPTETAEPAAEELVSVPPPSEILIDLRANEWQWVTFAGATEAFDIDMPQTYRVTFLDDGTFTAVTDCNNVSGAYIPTDTGEITITPGPMTLAACPEGSRGDQFVAFLGSATRYNVDGETLTIELFADGGTMTFVPAGQEATDFTPDMTGQATALVETLGNLSYTGILPDQAVTLTDGTGTYDDGSSGTPIVTLATNLIPTGDLDSDGALDAVAVLRDQSTGSGTFYFLSAVLDVLNNPIPTEALMIGDRIQIKSLAVDGETVRGQIIAPAESDPACCGTWLFDKAYELADGRLAETGSEQISQISSTNIVGNWSLVDLNAGQEPVAADAPITLEVSDGRVAGSAGCNTYNGSFTGAEEQLNGFTIGELATTMKMCEQAVMDQETLYLQRLAASTSWGYDFGRLAFVYPLNDTDFGTLLFESAAAPQATTGELPEALVAQLDEFLNSQIWTEGMEYKAGAPGIVLLVETPNGRYLNAAGVNSIEEGTPMQVDDRLQIGSNTKSFTTVVLTQMQEEGVLSWDDPLSKWLPEWAAAIPNGDQVTLRMMAQHTTGIWDYGDPIIGEAANNPEKLEIGYTPEELVQYAIDNGTPDFAPGESWKYSNTPYILLGMVAEKATGQTLDELFRVRIFEPLGLDTAVLIAGVPEEGEITSNGYWWTESGERINSTNWNASQGWAAGANAMTAEDLATYGKALAAGQLFQNPESLAEMLDFNPASLVAGLPGYGLGLIDLPGGVWGHEGQTAGFQSLWFVNPESGTLVVGLTNSAAYSGFNFLAINDILNANE